MDGLPAHRHRGVLQVGHALQVRLAGLPLRHREGSEGEGRPAAHGARMPNSSTIPAPPRSVIWSRTPPDRLAKYQSVADAPCSTSAAPSSYTVTSGPLT